MDLQMCNAAEEGRSCFADQKCSASALALQNIVKKLIKTEWENSVALLESGSEKWDEMIDARVLVTNIHIESLLVLLDL